MRLEAQAKAGFYPTPAEVVEIIQTWIGEKAPGLRRLLDPCCGTGEPAARIAAAAEQARKQAAEGKAAAAAGAAAWSTAACTAGIAGIAFGEVAAELIGAIRAVAGHLTMHHRARG